ncbi:bifunctional riboflavin kinase/FAD synthetase [Ochrobactrum teleogrylli]|uniref:Riboflavin biosynthesis protein n=2 Tax=Ochrobactrum TaxID=528 RepID=A0ABY2Y8A0_9HYPH|nr:MULTISPECIES: bifunctional riboflavin kinase/FAD synthetase [Brucella]NNU61958.1 bifunctional riboflavin kinase/FAD synthetase [[Ochrobactrum] soli]TNV18157.1 bifunctional riboflavin kinase/FAD synthetase [[Ochrobactrum] teleogrylli]
MTNSDFQRLSGTDTLPERLRNCVVAIGNFDGVHRGHQAVLERALEIAAKENLPAVVLTFEPHPRSFFKPDEPIDRLTDAREKASILRHMGFHAVVEQPFTAEFSSQSAEDFVQHILVEKLHASRVVTGYDFHFGKGRRGTPEFLLQAGEGAGFHVTLVDAFTDEGDNLVSSTRVRNLLCDGDVAGAAGLLGYRYAVCGEVIHGKKLGRTLGFPTANMQVSAQTSLKHGIYAVRFRRQDGSLHDGVASFGRRPTVDSDGKPLLETFLFDFSGDLYGEDACVSFFGFLRGEVKFDGLDALIVQMKRDEEEARALLAGARPLSELDRALSFE